MVLTKDPHFHSNMQPYPTADFYFFAKCYAKETAYRATFILFFFFFFRKHKKVRKKYANEKYETIWNVSNLRKPLCPEEIV